jgi:hypothetical protein
MRIKFISAGLLSIFLTLIALHQIGLKDLKSFYILAAFFDLIVCPDSCNESFVNANRLDPERGCRQVFFAKSILDGWFVCLQAR